MTASNVVPELLEAPVRAPAPAAPAEPAAPAPELDLELLEGEPAASLLRDPAFAAAWDRLAAACPWATPFQGRTFTSIWFDVYGDLSTPVVVTGTTPDGVLAGLLVLVAGPDRRRLAPAGTHHCEYQTWLALPSCGASFAEAALDRVARAFPSAALTLLNVPPEAPTAWARGARWSDRVLVESLPRALRDLGPEDGSSMRKKGNKSRFRQLEREGPVEFVRIEDRDAFGELLDAFVPVHDFRQAAVHGVMPFLEDPRKRAFHERLFDAGFLYVTALRAGGRLVAAQFGIPDHVRRMLSVGPHTYSPAHGRQSPGKLQMHLLAERLAAEGTAVLDLTPGAGWKDRFATRTDEVGILRISFRRRDHLRLLAARRRDAVAKRLALAAGTTPDAVRENLSELRRRGPAGVLAALLRRARRALALRERTTMTVSTMSAADAARKASPGLFAVDRLEDLLAFEPVEPWETRRRFLSTALQRLSDGHRVYTRVENGRLVCRGWMAPDAASSRLTEVDAEVPVPAGTWVLYDFYTHPSARRRGLYDAVLRQMLADAGRAEGCRSVWLGVDRDNLASSAAVAKVGFRPYLEATSERFLGRRVRRPGHRALHTPPTGAARVAQAAKRGVYAAARALGLFRLARRLTRGELRVLCWHGWDVSGESAFGPRLFMRTGTFERRLDALVAGGYSVLPLAEAVERLAAGTLPPCAVALTIDDGAASTLKAAEPLARRGLPATLYVTTYHVDRPTPVFETALGYMLWRSEAASLDLADLGPFRRGTVALDDENAVRAARTMLVDHAKHALDEPGRQRLAAEIARRLGLDWSEMEASRRCSLLTPGELRELPARGIDLQLHTHRHRFPCDEAQTRREIEENRAALDRVRPGAYDHLCYPSNEHDARQFPWLRELGVKSGTTCNPGLNPPGTDPLALRRFLDGECVAQVEFEAEVSGFAELLRRAVRRVLRRR